MDSDYTTIAHNCKDDSFTRNYFNGTKKLRDIFTKTVGIWNNVFIQKEKPKYIKFLIIVKTSYIIL
jgi:hypothetical protein